MRILLAEDDFRIADPVKAALVSSAFSVDVEADGEVVHFRGDTEDFDAVLLDLGLPTLDGLSILRRWRTSGRNMPVLITTARGQWEERVDAIEAGADDYLVKPFRIEELLARLRAVIRRSNGLAATRIHFAGLTLDTRLMQVFRDGYPVDLTPQEYRLLAYLAHHRGEVISQLRLTEHLYSQDFDRDSNSIEVLVGRLRKRIGRDVVRTRRGFGYYIESEAE
ncbi:MAG TPA: response regulator transcription factor [Alphaproteobacteria bacterium]|nr:response regulator transcription factor [Alphaproteobacteria bacterium]